MAERPAEAGSPGHCSAPRCGPPPQGRLEFHCNLGGQSPVAGGEAQADICLGAFLQGIRESPVPKVMSSRAVVDCIASSASGTITAKGGPRQREQLF